MRPLKKKSCYFTFFYSYRLIYACHSLNVKKINLVENGEKLVIIYVYYHVFLYEFENAINEKEMTVVQD
jgi:hypothetical protein